MTFVGPGGGQYTTEVIYKFVGAGGEYSVVAPRRSYFCMITSVVSLLVVLVLVLVLINLPVNPTTTTSSTYRPWTTVPPTTELVSTTQLVLTTKPRPPPLGTCTAWGDPHFVTFDGARPSFYGEGEFWIVKSDKIKIQGRYRGTEFTHGLSATNKVVVGGDFLHGHTIAVGTMESGELLVDGQPVLAGAFPSTFNLGNGLGTLIYNAEGELPDKAAAVFQKHIVHMLLPMSVTITVFRWDNYLDLRIQMPQQPIQDGSCGNFNGNPADDTSDQIFARIGARVPYSELIFNSHQDIKVSGEMEKMIAQDCPKQKSDAARAACQQKGMSIALDLDSCVFDICFGMNEHALRTAKTYG